uniref:Allophycocyanin beta 18 subunit n=1 Tax=Sciadococcus taiwanensis TaxID=3028030 RepID=A0A9Y1MWL3_9RHOD|nr:allophycocyanin beta 18 subunit [Sciadococcus taiwanensis]
MQDAITSIINRYDIAGKYLDINAINDLQRYFQSGIERIQIAKLINEKASTIIREASAQLFEEQPELLRPGGNAYTTRRYAACLRDVEYYLRYASYAIIAGDIYVLNERVLDGLKDTYNSLGVPGSPTVRVIQFLKEVIKDQVANLNLELNQLIEKPFDHMIQVLREKDI